MSDATEINEILAKQAPALHRAMSERGRALVFPRGIPFQAGQARSAQINGTIGQLTDGHGNAMPLGPLAALLGELDPKTSWLYSPIEGPAALRDAWLARQRRLAGGPDVALSRPFATHGLVHAVSLLAALVADEDLDVVVARPAWENYDLVLDLAGGGRFLSYDFFDEEGRFNLAGLEEQLGRVRKKSLVLLNFPNNPTGYVPTTAEVQAIAQLLAAQSKPTIVGVDDAYQGWVYDPSREKRSVFWELAKVADPETLLPFKIDGATKELVFFSSRVGFLTSTLTGAAADALESKLKCHVRGTVGCESGPALSVIEKALAHPGLEEAFEERRLMMEGRARLLKQGLDSLQSPRLRPQPFHGAFFALVKVDGDPEALRQTLIREHSTGVIAFPEESSLRLAFCSLAEEAIPQMVDRLGKAAASL